MDSPERASNALPDLEGAVENRAPAGGLLKSDQAVNEAPTVEVTIASPL